MVLTVADVGNQHQFLVSRLWRRRLYQITPAFSFIVPVRMLYVSGIGWNPIAEAGIVINLKNLPKAK